MYVRTSCDWEDVVRDWYVHRAVLGRKSVFEFVRVSRGAKKKMIPVPHFRILVKFRVGGKFGDVKG